MNAERFETLAEAFGGAISRWPAAERDAAVALMLARPDWAGGVLAQAGELDTRLNAYAAPRAPTALAEWIVAKAPRPSKTGWVAWLWPAGMGAGLAAASAAGFIVGMQRAAHTVPAAAAPSTISAMVDEEFSFDFDEEV